MKKKKKAEEGEAPPEMPLEPEVETAGDAFQQMAAQQQEIPQTGTPAQQPAADEDVGAVQLPAEDQEEVLVDSPVVPLLPGDVAKEPMDEQDILAQEEIPEEQVDIGDVPIDVVIR